MSQASETVAEFDRFDICEAYYLLACNWGLYGIIARLTDMGFKPSPALAAGTTFILTENGHAIYHELDGRLLKALCDKRLAGSEYARSLKGYTHL